jgi:hypothetical protein
MMGGSLVVLAEPNGISRGNSMGMIVLCRNAVSRTALDAMQRGKPVTVEAQDDCRRAGFPVWHAVDIGNSVITVGCEIFAPHLELVLSLPERPRRPWLTQMQTSTNGVQLRMLVLEAGNPNCRCRQAPVLTKSHV